MQDKDGNRYVYAIGGWNLNYLKDVYKIKMGANGSPVGSWVNFEPMQVERSDHACAEVQISPTEKGILAAGGYRTDGAWMSSVEFLDLRERFASPYVVLCMVPSGI